MPGRVVRKFLIERQLVEEVVPQHVPQRDPLVRIVVEHPGKNKFDNFFKQEKQEEKKAARRYVKYACRLRQPYSAKLLFFAPGADVKLSLPFHYLKPLQDCFASPKGVQNCIPGWCLL